MNTGHYPSFAPFVQSTTAVHHGTAQRPRAEQAHTSPFSTAALALLRRFPFFAAPAAAAPAACPPLATGGPSSSSPSSMSISSSLESVPPGPPRLLRFAAREPSPSSSSCWEVALFDLVRREAAGAEPGAAAEEEGRLSAVVGPVPEDVPVDSLPRFLPGLGGMPSRAIQDFSRAAPLPRFPFSPARTLCWCALRVRFDPRARATLVSLAGRRVCSPLLRAPVRRVYTNSFTEPLVAPGERTPDHVCCRTSKSSVLLVREYFPLYRRATQSVGDNKHGKRARWSPPRANQRPSTSATCACELGERYACRLSSRVFCLNYKRGESRVRRETHRPQQNKLLAGLFGACPVPAWGEDELTRAPRPVERFNLLVCLLVRLVFSWLSRCQGACPAI